MRLWLATVAVLFIAADALAFRGGGGGTHSSARSDAKRANFEWSGRYRCEQCTPTEPLPGTVPTPTSSPAPALAGCWKYVLTVLRDPDPRLQRGEIEVNGPDGQFTIRTKVVLTMSLDLIEFRFREFVETPKAGLSFQPDDLLVQLQHREDDIILRFKRLATKVPPESAILCKKE